VLLQLPCTTRPLIRARFALSLQFCCKTQNSYTFVYLYARPKIGKKLSAFFTSLQDSYIHFSDMDICIKKWEVPDKTSYYKTHILFNSHHLPENFLILFHHTGFRCGSFLRDVRAFMLPLRREHESLAPLGCPGMRSFSLRDASKQPGLGEYV
jgi:hypothetical protein